MNGVIPINPPKFTILDKAALGFAQILLWGGSYFILSVLGKPISIETGWTSTAVYSAVSLALLVSGIILPKMGRLVDTKFGYLLLYYSGMLMALGLVLVGLSNNYVIFLTGWVVIGAAMGIGLYDALFANLGKYLGTFASKNIIEITLISSLASSISWTISNHLLQLMGWRMTCITYAGILIAVILPLHRYAFRNIRIKKQSQPKQLSQKPQFIESTNRHLLLLLHINFTLGAVITSGMIIHMIALLESKGTGLNNIMGAVFFLGPAQASVRALELLLPKRSSAEMNVISAFVILIGIVALRANPIWMLPGIILFGMGNGLRSVLRGTLPLKLFGNQPYAPLMGKLGRWPLIAQALMPFAGGLLLTTLHWKYFFIIFFVLAFINLLVSIGIQKIAENEN